MKKIGYLLFSLGLIVISLNAKITGAVIGTSLEGNFTFLFGFILLVIGIILISSNVNLEERIEEEHSGIKLDKKERQEIISAFKDWRGSPNKRQREILKKFGLVYEIGGKHIYFSGDNYAGKQVAPTSPSDNRGGMNLAHQLIRYIENQGNYRNN